MIKKFDEYIKESYNNLGLIKPRSNYYLINEGQESKSRSQAKKLYMKVKNCDYGEAEKFIEYLRNKITALKETQIINGKEVELGKFTLGITRMFLNGEFDLDDTKAINDINSTIRLLSDIKYYSKYDKNLKLENGSDTPLTYQELISKFEQTRYNKIKKEKLEINRMDFGVSDYEIVKINSFDEATKYYKYTNPNNRWCITNREDMYTEYTCGDINQIYFCLKNGFENIKPKVGKNAPLDEYGLSMLSIIVDDDGELVYCTTRWNHDNDGNDYSMNVVEISKVVNVNFYEKFKPNTKWNDAINNVNQKLSNGESVKNIFEFVSDLENGYSQVWLNGKTNIINDERKLMFNKWFDNIDDFENGYAQVELNKKFNFININCKILFDIWFDDIVESFEDGSILVVLNGMYNMINDDKKIISKKWFDNIDFNYFGNGNIRIKLENVEKWNLITKSGKFVFDEPVDFIVYYGDDYALVKFDGKYNILDKNCNFLSDKWLNKGDELNSILKKFKII
jgi:hypothetical protein